MEKDVFIQRLEAVLADISELHRQVSEEWIDYAKENGIPVFNQKAVNVSELESKGLMDSIIEYRRFIVMKRLLLSSSEYNCEGITFDRRYKTVNSIMEKLEDYCMYSEERGKVPVNKCFNDLFGARIIVDCECITSEDIKNCVEGFENLICVDKHFDLVSSEDTYVATHIYFNNGRSSEERNRQFRWELQIWTKCQERNNHRLHQTHRFKYRKWEGGQEYV